MTLQTLQIIRADGVQSIIRINAYSICKEVLLTSYITCYIVVRIVIDFWLIQLSCAFGKFSFGFENTEWVNPISYLLKLCV